MPSTELALPPQLGRYRILRKLGAGGMGAVYLAEDTQLQRSVALKVPHLSDDGNSTARERFLREARIAAGITHPDLCPVYDAAAVGEICYLVMPYIEGSPLSQFIGPSRPWTAERAAGLVRRLALAAQVMHDKGIIHRDLKPANIMMRAGGAPMIMDFGLARSHSLGSHVLTREGTPIGTPAYMAPEQVLGEQQAIGPATDQYSLGVLLYELLTGSLPFEGPPAAVYGQILHATPAPPSRRRPGIENHLDDICIKAMARQTRDRFATLSAFAQALDRTMPQVVIPLASPAPLEPEILGGNLVQSGASTRPPAAELTPPLPVARLRAAPPPAPVITCAFCGKKLLIPPKITGRSLFCTRCGADLPGYERQTGRSLLVFWLIFGFLALLGVIWLIIWLSRL